jgi:hypothetical protein
MSQEEEVLVLLLDDSDIERFVKVEGGSSADIMGEVERLAVAEDTGSRESERPAGAEARPSRTVQYRCRLATAPTLLLLATSEQIK